MPKFTAEQRAEKCVLPLETALYRACKDLRGSTGAIAELYGLNPNTFALKINPERTTHHLNPSEVEIIIQHTHDPRIMDSVCQAFSNDEKTAYWYEVPTIHEDQANSALMQGYSELIEQMGNLGKTLCASLEDGIIDDDEVSAIEKCQRILNAKTASVVKRAKLMRDSIK